MSIIEQIPSVTYKGNGAQTQFEFPFPILAEENLSVSIFNTIDKATTELELGTDYDVVVENNEYPAENGYIIYMYKPTGEGLPVGLNLTIDRAVPYEQQSVYPPNTLLNPEQIEDDLDNLEMQIQQLKLKDGRLITIPPGYEGTTEDYLEEFWDAVQNGGEQALNAADRAENAADRAEDVADEAEAWAKEQGLWGMDDNNDLFPIENTPITADDDWELDENGDITPRGTVESFQYPTHVRVVDVFSKLQGLNLKTGQLVMMQGFYEPADGGGASYVCVDEIGEDETADGYGLIALNNGRYLKLRHNGVLNVKWFGAKGNGVTDDTEAIQKCFAFADLHKSKIVFPRAIYGVTGITYNASINPVNIDFCFSTLLFLNSGDTSSPVFTLITQAFDGENYEYWGGKICNLKIDCANRSILGFKVQRASCCLITNLVVFNICETGYSHIEGSAVTLMNAVFSGYSSDVLTTAVIAHADSVYYNITGKDITIGIKEQISGGRIDVQHVHFWYQHLPTKAEIYKQSCCIRVSYNAVIYASHIIADGIFSIFCMEQTHAIVQGSNCDMHNAISPTDYSYLAEDGTTQFAFYYLDVSKISETCLQNISGLGYYQFTTSTIAQKISNLGEDFCGCITELGNKTTNVIFNLAIPKNMNTGVVPKLLLLYNPEFSSATNTQVQSALTQNQYMTVASGDTSILYRTVDYNVEQFSFYPKGYIRLLIFTGGSTTRYLSFRQKIDLDTLNKILNNELYVVFKLISKNYNSHVTMTLSAQTTADTDSITLFNSGGNTYFIAADVNRTWAFRFNQLSNTATWLNTNKDNLSHGYLTLNIEIPANGTIYFEKLGLALTGNPNVVVP